MTAGRWRPANKNGVSMRIMSAKIKSTRAASEHADTTKAVKKNVECEAGTREHRGRSAAYDAGGQRGLSARACRACCDGAAQRVRAGRGWADGLLVADLKHVELGDAIATTMGRSRPPRGPPGCLSAECPASGVLRSFQCAGLPAPTAIPKFPSQSNSQFPSFLRNRDLWYLFLMPMQQVSFAIEIYCAPIPCVLYPRVAGWQPEPCAHAFTQT